MKRQSFAFLTLLVAGLLSPLTALADTVNLGFISYDVTGTNLAEFDIFNETGINSSVLPDTTFPVTTSVNFSNLSLTIDYSGGQVKTFGSSYFTLSSDGLSFNGTGLSTLAGSPTGLKGAVEAILTGTISPTSLTLLDGTKDTPHSTFSAIIIDPTGLTDGDFGIIQGTITPEPAPLLLAGSGLLGLLLMRRRLLISRVAPASTRRSTSVFVGLGLGCLFLLAAERPSAAQSVNLSAWTAPNSGAAGTTAVNLTGSGFPSGTIPAANVTLTAATACGVPGITAQVNSVTKIIGSSERVQFVIPASLSSATYFVSLSGTTSTGTAFASANCAEVSVVGSAPIASLSTSSLTFSSLTAGTSSPTQAMTLTNTGTSALNVSGVTLSGTGANLFPESDNCASPIAVGSFCTITIGFNPKIAGPYSATVTVSDNASPTTQIAALSGAATASPLAIDTTNATDWKITNGVMTFDFNPSKQRIFGIHIAGFPDNLVDTTNSNMGIYMDNAGNIGAGTTTNGFVNAGTYLDWWVTTASNATTNAYTYSMHFVVFPNDPGVHTYFVANHATTDIAGSIGQVQWVYRSNLNDFNNTYSVNADLSNPGPVKIPLPPASENFSTDPGRAVSDATVDLHGFTLPAGFTREFYTKYDYSSYNYLHQAHGTYGTTYGTWGYFPSNESLVGGPTKQNLIYTGNLLILEAYSNHYDNALTLNTAAGVASNRLFGPFYIHFNTFGQAYTATGNTIATPDDMYQDTLQAGASLMPLYDSEAQLLAAGYTPSTARGSVSVQVNNAASLSNGVPKTAWAVLSDPQKNIQFSSQGYQYWADISATGSATFNGVVPGTYRLSVYVLGQWGELRQDGIVVSANATTTVPAVSFVPENFGGETVFTIGTPDRSGHEFLHGHDAQGHDDREFWGTWNYWADFLANSGAVIYNATAGPNGPATNDLSKWNYNHWGTFDPGLYDASNDSTDNYKNVIPSYVASLTGAAGTNGITTRLPSWTVHFASPADVANYQFAVVSVALACDEGSYVLDLNGTSSNNARTWSFTNASDCAVRSGLSGYTQWVAFQFPIVALKGAGLDNVLSIGISQTTGDMDDAIRLELTNTGAAPATTGWNDYEYVPTSSTSSIIHANDTVPNP